MREPVKRGWLPDWVWQVLVLLFAFTFVAQPFVIPSGSMENSLLIGDHVLVDKVGYAPGGGPWLPYAEVSRGDVIVFRSPFNLKETLVKRAIGVPGDRIRLVDKQLYLNGRAVEEPYKIHTTPDLLPYRDRFPGVPDPMVTPGGRLMLRDHVRNGELVVPPGHYFALGDNRDSSFDSRYWGLVPRDNIIGKPLLIWWSYDAPGEHLLAPVDLRHITDLAQHFFTRTRWQRTFKLVRAYPLR